MTQQLDIDDLKKVRRMGRKMTALYEVLDPAVAKSTAHLTISCKPGCAGCCYLLALISLPEGVAIAEYFLEDTQRRNLIPLLMRSFYEQVQSMPSGSFKSFTEVREQYFEKKVACTFLDTETKLCTIYPVRPGACRYHMVVSDPKLCQPEAGVQEVARPDTREAEARMLSEANRVSNQAKVPLYVAPLPVVMLWAFKLLIEGRKAFEEALKDESLGAMGLHVWMDLLHAHQQARQVPPPPPPVTPGETPAPGSD
jgi:Fe-S-cluster containining protein